MPLWIAFTLAAAAVQTLRFLLQKRLADRTLSPAGATFARFVFAAPLALAAAAVAVVATGAGLPAPSGRFALFVLVGGTAQIVATVLTVALFSMRNFAVGIAFTKTETILVATAAVIVLGEVPTVAGWAAILVGFLGVLVLSRPPQAGARLFGRPAAFGLGAGALFGLSAIGYRGATLELLPLPFLLRALLALAAATAVQTLIMAVWLALRAPGEMGRVFAAWRRTVPVGVTGMLGSLCWFAAFALQAAAYVRALGQVEIVFTLIASAWVLGERLRVRELLGIALVVVSLIAIVLLTG